MSPGEDDKHDPLTRFAVAPLVITRIKLARWLKIRLFPEFWLGIKFGNKTDMDTVGLFTFCCQI